MFTPSKRQTKIVFWGSSLFSLPALQKLFASEYKISAIVTQSDKPSGRGKRNSENIIKKWALKHKIDVLQPERATEVGFINSLKIIKPDVFVIVSYGKILKKNILEIPKHGSLNIHASLLPKYRGASPIQAAILNGDTTIGVCIMVLDQGMDTGPIVSKNEIHLDDTDTAGTMENKLAEVGGNLLINILPDWLGDKILPIPQIEIAASYCGKISKSDGKIQWTSNAIEIERKIRAFNPWPSAWSKLSKTGELVKFHSAKVVDNKTSPHLAGQIYFVDTKKIAVACGKNSAVLLDIIQPANKKPMTAYEYYLGHHELLSSTFE